MDITSELDDASFLALCRLSLDYLRRGIELAQASPELTAALELLKSGEVRAELRIAVDAPFTITAALVDARNGEDRGQLFEHKGRAGRPVWSN